MTEDIINAVANSIKKAFTNVDIYNDIIKQGFKTPCFCISTLTSENNLFRGNRYKFSSQIAVRYYYDKRPEGNSLINKIQGALECIDVENIGLLYGFNILCEGNIENYLEFKVDYEFFYFNYEVEKSDLMGSVNVNFNL